MEKGEKERMLDSVYIGNKAVKGDKEIRHILKVMSKVDRKYFVAKKDKKHPYEDFPMEIGYGQTISQPTTVARMLLMAGINEGMDVLEVGSGSGWNACLMASLAYPGKVTTFEIIEKLSDFAKSNYEDFSKKEKQRLNIEFMKGSVFSYEDLRKKHFDVMMVTAASPEFLKEKLKTFDFGRMIIPTSDGAIEIWKKKGKKAVLEKREEGYAFVPLVER